MKKKAAVVAALVILMVIAVGYFVWQQSPTPQTTEGISVVASFYPLAEFARQVAGDLAEVKTVVPAGTEPHEYEPTPQELAQVYTATVFIYNGSGVDPWAERIAPELKQQGVRVINMSEVVSLLTAPTVEGQAAESQFDPHFWLDPVVAQKEVEAIREALIVVDPAHAAAYRAQAEAYLAQLTQLDQEYRQGLRACARRDIVTSHAAFGYLAREYNLTVITIAGLSPEEEPSARTLSEIATLAREKNITYIFFETLVSPKLAQTVAAEIGAQTLVFNPLEGLTAEEQQTGKNYVTVMRDNLRNLRLALDCT